MKIRNPLKFAMGICYFTIFLLSIMAERNIVVIALWGIVAVGNIVISFIDFS